MPVGYEGPPVHREWVVDQMMNALIALSMSEAEVSILLCDDQAIRPLNEQWRGQDQATDVLSFPQLELDSPLVNLPGRRDGDAPTVLGDVVISLESATRQATEVGHGVREELLVLLVHGLCHLLGHQHDEPGTRQQMAEAEAAVLSAILPGACGVVARSGAAE